MTRLDAYRALLKIPERSPSVWEQIRSFFKLSTNDDGRARSQVTVGDIDVPNLRAVRRERS